MFYLWCLLLTALVLQTVAGTTVWPKGRYALLKPTTGCPDGWKGKGWLLQDTEDTSPSNNRSEILHIDGYVSPSYVIRSFCVKTDTSQGPNWPQGRYCIYRKRNESILTGLRAGNIKMKHETSFNKDTAIYLSYKDWIKFSLSSPYNHLVLYFQCMINGNTTVPISLPIAKPFYLLPYGSRDCQQVKWMVATTEWIKYHTRDYNDSHEVSEIAPYHEVGDINHKGITMYYCYYQSCNYTLTDKEGVFQSPGFPGKYPDGQLCSWRIVVPDNHTVRVHFTHFSLDENDTKDALNWYKSINSTFQLTETLHGFIEPFTLTETSDLLFKFVSNEEGHALGFRAEYTVFIPGETTLEPPSLTPESSNSPTTTTPIPTEHISEITTESTIPRNRTAFALEAQCKGIDTIVVIVIPLACVVFVVIVIIIVVYRYRIEDKIAANPIYDQGDILLTERGSITTINTTMDFNGGQMYQTISHDQKTTTNDEYHSNCQVYQSLSRDQKPGCDGRKEMDDPSTDFERPTYHELEPVDHKVPDVVYGVLEGPDPNDGPSGDQVYQAVDDNTTHESFYQYTTPGTMVTQNSLYDSFT